MRTTTRTWTGMPCTALLISLSIAAGLVGCAPLGKAIALGEDPSVELAKDPAVPLLIIARKKMKNNAEVWCPVKVVSIAQQKCPAGILSNGGETACRLQGQRISWFAQDEATYENPGPAVDFEISFAAADPLDEKNIFKKVKCAKSQSGALGCKIKQSTPPDKFYEYKVTMSGGSDCELDPRIYVNRY